MVEDQTQFYSKLQVHFLRIYHGNSKEMQGEGSAYDLIFATKFLPVVYRP